MGAYFSWTGCVPYKPFSPSVRFQEEMRQWVYARAQANQARMNKKRHTIAYSCKPLDDGVDDGEEEGLDRASAG